MNQTTKTHQFLRIVILLSRGRYLTPHELAQELQLDLRTIYRYIADLKASDFFVIEQRGNRLRISSKSHFWLNVFNSLYLTDEEAIALNGLLDSLHTDDTVLLHLQEKARRIVSNYIEPLSADGDPAHRANTDNIERAIAGKRLCLLRNYYSANSDTRADRLVEPFCFIGSRNEVRCYELASQKNKTFKLTRCESIEVLDVPWQFEQKHKTLFTDIFHFSDEQKTRIRLLLGNRAKTLLLEEFPAAHAFVFPHTDGRWMFDAEYCSMKGIGRFYLGLFDDIEIVDSPEFQTYIAQQAANLSRMVQHP